MKKKKIRHKLPINDSIPSSACTYPKCNKSQTLENYQGWIKKNLFKTAKIDIPKTMKPKQKKVRRDDLALYNSLIHLVEFIGPFSKTAALIATKNSLLEKNGEEEKNSCAYLRIFCGSIPAVGAPEHVILKEVEQGTRLGNEVVSADIVSLYSDAEISLNRRIVDIINFLQWGYHEISHDLFNGKQGTKAKQWYVDRLGDAAAIYLPDWNKYKKRNPRRPSFKKSYEILKKFANGTTSKELGYTKSQYHHLRYEVVPQGAVHLLSYMHLILYAPPGLVSPISMMSACRSIMEILKDYSPTAASLICDMVKKRLTEVLPIPKTRRSLTVGLPGDPSN